MRRYLALGLGSLVLGAAAALLLGLHLPEVRLDWDGVPMADYRGTGPPESGPELAFVYIGSSSCTWSNAEGLPELVAELKSMTAAKADDRNLSFTTIGIARDLHVGRGLDHLRKYAPFDEVTSGRGWLNLGALRYVFEDVPGPASTPQILVLWRQVVVEDDRRSVEEPELLVRKVGLREIERWHGREAPLPTELSSGAGTGDPSSGEAVSAEARPRDLGGS